MDLRNSDYTKFLNSRDIAHYLRKIGYEWTPEQAMYVIHAAAENSIGEKHAAYEELIGRSPTMPCANGDKAFSKIKWLLLSSAPISEKRTLFLPS